MWLLPNEDSLENIFFEKIKSSEYVLICYLSVRKTSQFHRIKGDHFYIFLKIFSFFVFGMLQYEIDTMVAITI